ncbi:unnamed protein product [Darwinula stevensoni]|uniref:SAGA-associated factor 11 n=1 Tax=Darwinula stevensoni TaxID=69355 RepID=A0A7R8X6S2_9CRUS|nr:unnamed protein product [Darwinula stevensoni]CAG0886072.1 unnamed protein product [Darwinula stevensoni]
MCVMRTPDILEEIIGHVFGDLLEDVILRYAFDLHEAITTGVWEAEEGCLEMEDDEQIVDEPGVDIFGQNSDMKNTRNLECACPKCQRTLGASRFATHLEKCTGIGRLSSRIANQRIITNNTKDSSGPLIPSDNDDEDWTNKAESKSKSKKRKEKNSTRTVKAARVKADDSSAMINGLNGDEVHYELLKKLEENGRSGKKNTRKKLIDMPVAGTSDLPSSVLEEDSDSSLFRLVGEYAFNPSPTDSSSTNNSTSSRKREAYPSKGKGASAKRKKDGSQKFLSSTGD